MSTSTATRASGSGPARRSARARASAVAWRSGRARLVLGAVDARHRSRRWIASLVARVVRGDDRDRRRPIRDRAGEEAVDLGDDPVEQVAGTEGVGGDRRDARRARHVRPRATMTRSRRRDRRRCGRVGHAGRFSCGVTVLRTVDGRVVRRPTVPDGPRNRPAAAVGKASPQAPTMTGAGLVSAYGRAGHDPVPAPRPPVTRPNQEVPRGPLRAQPAHPRPDRAPADRPRGRRPPDDQPPRPGVRGDARPDPRRA